MLIKMHVNMNGSNSLRNRDLITLEDFTLEEIDFVFNVAKNLKQKMAYGKKPRILDRKNLYMVFNHNPSERLNKLSENSDKKFLGVRK